jgi:hypothetical protein
MRQHFYGREFRILGNIACARSLWRASREPALRAVCIEITPGTCFAAIKTRDI